MAQGFIRPNAVTDISLFFGDSAAVDAFGRLRVSSPTAYVFDAQLTYDLQPLLFEPITAESGATIAHDATNRQALMTFASTPTGGKAYLQSFEHFRYQPGRSQQIWLSFNFIETAANVLKFVGYNDGSNGIELQQDGSTVQLKLFSDTANGDQTVAQSSWNLDKMDGSGASGITLDLTKQQVLTIDFQALYSGRVRVGFDIGGQIIYVHEFQHGNTIIQPYIQSANLPIRCGMTCTGTVSTTMHFTCSSVVSENGQAGAVEGFTFSTEGTATAGSGTRTHVLSIRPKTTFNSIVNRVKYIPEAINILVTGVNPVLWELCLGQAISGTTAFNDVNATFSAFEFNTAGTISGSPAIVTSSGYVAASGTQNAGTSANLIVRYPITLDAAGAVRANGTVSIIATGIGGASALRASLLWREIR
jgi:hypothetical protein